MTEFWGEEENVSEYELAQDDVAAAAEVDVDETPPAPVDYEDIPQEEVAQVQEDAAFELDKHETSVIYNAKLRLERAKLYEMLINHDLFAGVDASPQAIKHVQNELKQYIVARLEILLGIRQEKKIVQAQNMSVKLPFNSTEVDFLKQLSYKGTKGESKTGAAVVAPAKPSGLKPLQSSPKPQLKSLASQVEEDMYEAPKPKAKPQKTATKSVQSQIKNAGNQRELTPSEIEALATEDLKKMDERKPWLKMSGEEKVQEIKRVNSKHAKARPTNAIPMPSQEDMNVQITARSMTTQNIGNSPVFGAIMARVNKNKLNNPIDGGNDDD